MDISLQTYFLEVKKKIFFLIAFLIVVVLFQTFYNKLRANAYNISFKANFYDMNVLYSVIKMVNKNDVFNSETQAQNFIYQFQTQIPKRMKTLSGLQCKFKTNILTCSSDGVQLDPGKIDGIKNNLGSNIKVVLQSLFITEIKLVDDKISSLQKLFQKLDGLEELEGNEEGNVNEGIDESILSLGTVKDKKNELLSNPSTSTLKERKIASLVKVEELEYLKNTLSSFADLEDGIEYQVFIGKINLQKNTLIVFFCALAFGLIIIFLTINRKNT